MVRRAICEALQAAGHGTLCYNFRGQINTEFADETDLSPTLIVDDLVKLLAVVQSPRPILVGLSIGGLFAAQAFLAGAPAEALVLINTLRKPSQRLDWINQAMVRGARRGGGRLVMMMNMPVIGSPKLISELWEGTFTDEPIEAPAENDGLFRLIIGSLETDWDFPYENLDLPVLLLTGAHDRVFRIETDVEALKARIRDAGEIIYEDAGHLIPLENPARFSDDLIAFADHVG